MPNQMPQQNSLHNSYCMYVSNENQKMHLHVNESEKLLPDCTLSVSDKVQLFSIRCEMNDLSNSFGKKCFARFVL